MLGVCSPGRFFFFLNIITSGAGAAFSLHPFWRPSLFYCNATEQAYTKLTLEVPGLMFPNANLPSSSEDNDNVTTSTRQVPLLYYLVITLSIFQNAKISSGIL